MYATRHQKDFKPSPADATTVSISVPNEIGDANKSPASRNLSVRILFYFLATYVLYAK